MSEPLTGTDDHPIERIPDQPSTRRDWAVLLGGPAIWFVHFMGVYLLAEATCTAGDEGMALLGVDPLVAAVVAATAVAAVGCIAVAWTASRRTAARDHEIADMATGGVILALGSLVGVVAVGLPALVLEPVC